MIQRHDARSRMAPTGIPLGPVSDVQRKKPPRGRYSPTVRPRKSWPHDLNRLQADVLELIGVAPRDLKEASEALGIGEWSLVRHALDQLVLRGLAEEVGRFPTRWRAV